MATSHRRIVGQKIFIYRKRAGISQEKLAGKADLSYKYVGEIERGVVNTSFDSLARIAKALKLHVNNLTRDI
ncbi:MAG TPA: helix-turn-helix transcriptional regulator [Verrucomicrobiae bacterium]|nr:helix-turn-helix transcriptional regulator [Verrucomicrobiae bacterium]